MGQQTYVVQISGTDMYLTAYNYNDPPNSLFGNLENAITFTTQDEADTTAATIGGGVIGIPRPH